MPESVRSAYRIAVAVCAIYGAVKAVVVVVGAFGISVDSTDFKIAQLRAQDIEQDKRNQEFALAISGIRQSQRNTLALLCVKSTPRDQLLAGVDCRMTGATVP